MVICSHHTSCAFRPTRQEKATCRTVILILWAVACAGCTYLWTVAMDSQRPEIASQAGDLLISLHLDLSGHLEQEQAAVRSSLIRCASCLQCHSSFLCGFNMNWL